MSAGDESQSTHSVVPPSAPRNCAAGMVIGGRIAPADVPLLCERLAALLRAGHGHDVVCDVGRLIRPDAVTVDALARLQLTARRLGHQISLRHAPPALQELLAFAGLCDVVPLGADSGVQVQGQPEEWEQGGGIEE